MRYSKYPKVRPLLLCGVLGFTLATAPAMAVGGPPLASGPERSTNDPYYNTLNGSNGGGYGDRNHSPGGRRWDCKFYNPYVPFQNQQYCQ
jgi:hypothetical protein